MTLEEAGRKIVELEQRIPQLEQKTMTGEERQEKATRLKYKSDQLTPGLEKNYPQTYRRILDECMKLETELGY